MPKKPGAYHRPETVEEALQLLNEPDSLALAGGTKLLASESGLPVDHVVDLQALGLSEIAGGEGGITIGATCTLSGLMAVLAHDYGEQPASQLLREVIKREGPNTYRNAATVGGSIASRLPDSELLAALLVLDADLNLAGSAVSETPSLADYLSELDQPEGLITSVTFPLTEGAWAAERVARTPADYPIVSVVAWHRAGGSVHLAATGISSRPKRLLQSEAELGEGLSDVTITAAAGAASDAADHPGDFRGDAGYRAKMVEVLTRRALGNLA